MILGLHHISLKTKDDLEYEKVRAFYVDLLHLRLLKECETCTLFDTGSGIVEVFRNGTEPMPQGVIRHMAFAVDDVDAAIEKVRAAGYPIHVEPKDVQIGGDPAFPARIVFCFGPRGGQIEFFCQKW